MKTELLHWDEREKAFSSPAISKKDNTNLVLYFGDRRTLSEVHPYDELRKKFPTAQIIGCSTGGQIYQKDVGQAQIVATAIEFSDTNIEIADVQIDSPEQSLNAGKTIGETLQDDDLAGVMLFSDGLCVNGSQLANGINEILGEDIPIVGGLAGDGDRFETTLIGGKRSAQPQSHRGDRVLWQGDLFWPRHRQRLQDIWSPTQNYALRRQYTTRT